MLVTDAKFLQIKLSDKGVFFFYFEFLRQRLLFVSEQFKLNILPDNIPFLLRQRKFLELLVVFLVEKQLLHTVMGRIL